MLAKTLQESVAEIKEPQKKPVKYDAIHGPVFSYIFALAVLLRRFFVVFVIIRKLNLLSFGEEAELEEKELAVVKQKIKSSHDVLNDPRLLKAEATSKERVMIQFILFVAFAFPFFCFPLVFESVG